MKKHCYLTVGPSGCGKSTWAQDFANKYPGTFVTERDNIRYSMITDLFPGKEVTAELMQSVFYSKNGKEDDVTTIQRQEIIQAVGMDEVNAIIVSDTNLNANGRSELRSFIESLDVEVSYITFDDIFFDQCIENNNTRTGWKKVPERVIRQQYVRFREEFPLKYRNFLNRPDAYVFDIDGTVAKMCDRSPYDWHKVGEDEPHNDVLNLASDLYHSDNKIIFLSGRDGVCYPETREWLNKHFSNYHLLIMRPVGNNMKDSVIKHDMFHQQIARHYNVKGVFDDRNQVVNIWRKMGLRCYQVSEGDF